jgi:hypothetical protein
MLFNSRCEMTVIFNHGVKKGLKVRLIRTQLRFKSGFVDEK